MNKLQLLDAVNLIISCMSEPETPRDQDQNDALLQIYGWIQQTTFDLEPVIEPEKKPQSFPESALHRAYRKGYDAAMDFADFIESRKEEQNE